MTDPFIVPLPRVLAEDQQVAPYFNFQHKVLHDLTILRAAIDNAGDITEDIIEITGYTPHASGAVAVVSESETDLDTTAAAVNTLVDESASMASQLADMTSQLTEVKDILNTVLQMLRDHGIIAT